MAANIAEAVREYLRTGESEVLFHVVGAHQSGKPSGMLPPGGLADVKFHPDRPLWVACYAAVAKSENTTGVTASVVGMVIEHIADDSNVLSCDVCWTSPQIGHAMMDRRFAIDNAGEIVRAGLFIDDDGYVDHVAVLSDDELAAGWTKGLIDASPFCVPA